MALSALDLFSIGIGPSSSHTVGPMRAAATFVGDLHARGIFEEVGRVTVDLFGSLGATGLGHGSDKAIILGLCGEHPESVDTATVDARVAAVVDAGMLHLNGERTIAFSRAHDLTLHRKRSLPAHPNGMIFRAFHEGEGLLYEATFYSVGGGFVVRADDVDTLDTDTDTDTDTDSDSDELPFAFETGGELLEHCRREGSSIAQIMLANEMTWRSEAELRSRLLGIWGVMRECVHNGCTATEPMLPGSLRVPRRAPELYARLTGAVGAAERDSDPIRAIDWVNLYALAVNEENASGGRVVTAPTNGAAGIIPAVLHYCDRFVPGTDDDSIVVFMLTAAAVGILFKKNASISGAEVGCQGEVGSACSMAAAGLCAVMGGSPTQVENAAEIGIEHNLGLTCDPIGGLVQIPCIERNAIASGKAISAARMAMYGDGSHRVSLDQAIRTMRDTGADMKRKYKETSLGGLAVNVVEC